MITASRGQEMLYRIILKKKVKSVNLHFQDLRESSVKANNTMELSGTTVAEYKLWDRM